MLDLAEGDLPLHDDTLATTYSDPAGEASTPGNDEPDSGGAGTPLASRDEGTESGVDSQLDENQGGGSDDLDVDYSEERSQNDSLADLGVPAEPLEAFDFDAVAAESLTLASHLEGQAALCDEADFPVISHLIALLDDAGYLTEPLQAIAERLGLELAELERCLAILQGFEPTGVAARSLAECITLQAKDADRYDPCMAALIDNLELVARGDLAQLRRLCNVDAADLVDMLRELRGYNPKPGLLFGSERSIAVVPDIFIRRSRKAGDDGFVVELNSATLPRLIVNRSYQARISAHGDKIAERQGERQGETHNKDAAKAERQYLDQCMSRAQWLIRTLDQRATTIMKVVTELVKEQTGFFHHGVRHLKPLTLRQIADTIGMHESTVSRVTSNKYLSCDRGVFELKYFFTSAIQGTPGHEGTSGEAVRQHLKALIDSEPPQQPHSDDRLVKLLHAEGVDVARRTVTKYREALNIPSSFDRRRRALSKF